jgi:NADH:ubiquinone oxidoreductase subunit C
MNTQEILTLAGEITKSWDWVTETEQPESNRLDAKLRSPNDLLPIVAALRVKRLGYLAAITGLDLGTEANELEVLYHFCAGAAVITLRVRLPREGASVPTLSEIIPSAESYERELSEMFGVTIKDLCTPEHLYLPDDWPETTYPLRKDFNPETLTSPATTYEEQTNGNGPAA